MNKQTFIKKLDDTQKWAKNIDIESINSQKDFLDIIKTFVSFLTDILKSPIVMLSDFVKKELVTSIKKDMKGYIFIGFAIVILFVLFSILWISISVLVATYAYHQGLCLTNSIIISVLFQILVFVLILLVSLVSIKRLKSIKIIKKLKNVINTGNT